MYSVELKWVPSSKLFNLRKKMHKGQILVSTEHVWALVFVSQLNSGGMKSLCELICCLGTKANYKATSIVLFGSSLKLCANFILMPKQHSVLTRVLTFFHICISSYCSQTTRLLILHILSSFWKLLATFRHINSDRTSPLYASCNKMKFLVAVFLNFTTNLMFIIVEYF